MRIIRKLLPALLFALLASPARLARGDDDVLLQGFYWDCPKGWYARLEKEAPALAKAGFTAIWLPPPSKGASGDSSMGYDVFDHYDLGEYDQKGTVPTRFGRFHELRSLVKTLHKTNVKAYADVVLNHCIGGELEANPLTGTSTWTRFAYPHHRFEKSFADFHPSAEHRDNDAPYHSKDFGEDLCQQHERTARELEAWGDWITKRVGYDGFRLDFVKGVDPGFLKRWLSGGRRNGKFAVSECWDADASVLDQLVRDTDGRSSVFDFTLFYTIKQMCNDTSGGFDMRRLDGAGYAAKNPLRAVTFVENHDTDRSDPVITDKGMAYAFVLVLEGYPCVFYKDYAVYGLRDKIDALISVRKRFAGGSTTTLWKDEDLFVAQRNGNDKVPGCVLVLNDHAKDWKGAWVTVKKEWAGKDLVDQTGQAMPKTVAADGRVQLWAPPRGYAVYAPR